MSDPAVRSRLAIAQEYLLHLTRGETEGAVALLSDHISYRSNGNHALAGTFTGRDEVAAHLRELFERTRGTFEAAKFEDWLVGEHHVAAVTTIHAQQHGRRYSGRQVTVLGFDTDDRIDRATVFFEDQGAMDRFMGS